MKPVACEACGCDETRACSDTIAGTNCFLIEVPGVDDEPIVFCSVCARIMLAMVRCGELNLGEDSDAFVQEVAGQLARHITHRGAA